jgi:polysaccharide biosynthesis transport protein
MSIAEITAALWRRRLLFAITLVACIGAVAVITAAVPRVYKATATIYVGTDTKALDTDQGEQLARTYTTLAGNANVAEAAIDALNTGFTRQQLLDKMSFTPVERTQLLEIGAEDTSAAKATQIANAYANVFTDTVNAQVAQGKAPASVAVTQPAVEPTDPVRPNPALYLAFGAILSVLIAAAAALVRDRFDHRLRIGRESETVHGELILARIPTLLPRAADGDGAPATGYAAAARILRSDAFRILRTNLDLSSETPARIIAITSPGQGEGKTTISAQLALTIATDREKVAIIECDLRRRALDESGLGTQWKRAPTGLTEYLDGKAGRDKIVRSTAAVPNLNVVWAGTPVPEPGPLLRSPRLLELIEFLQRHNDWIILDTPPIAVGDDALIVSSHVEGTVVVVDAEVTTDVALKSGLNQLRKIRARVLGVAINHAPPAELDSYRYLTEPAPEPARAARAARSGRSA